MNILLDPQLFWMHDCDENITLLLIMIFEETFARKYDH